MKKLLGLGFLLLVAGCTSTAAPQVINGNYYMAGDDACAFTTAHPTEQKITCFDRKRKSTGERLPITAQQMQMYYMQQQQIAAQNQQAAQMYNPNYQIQPNVYQPMVIPQVTPLYRPGGNQVRCLSTGFYTTCKQY